MLAFTWAASSLLVPLILMTRTPSSGRVSASKSRSSATCNVQVVGAASNDMHQSTPSRHIVSRRIVSRRICSTYGSAGASYIKKLSLGLVVLMAASSMPVAEGVCIHCKGTIAGCQEGDLCPLVADIAPAVLRTLERFPALPSLSMLGVVSERVAPVETERAAQRVLVWEREID